MGVPTHCFFRKDKKKVLFWRDNFWGDKSIAHCPCKEHDVIFSILPEENSGDKSFSQSQAGKCLSPPMVWKGQATTFGWQFKWSLNGIQPQRAIVLMVHDVTIPAGKVFFLN